MKITIGMPAFLDAVGVDLTVASLRHYHSPELLRDIELLVVDNAPQFRPTPEGHAIPEGDTADYVNILSSCSEFRGWRVVPLSSPRGTAVAKNRVFREAADDSELVICIDSHVQFLPGSLAAVIKFFTDRPGFGGLIHGPLKFNPPGKYATQFRNIWASEMWGRWAETYRCVCGGDYFAVNDDDPKQISYVDAATSAEKHKCDQCGLELPPLPAADHRQALLAFGYQAAVDTHEPFPIWATGCWAMACRKDSWLGFHAESTGFGGEEVLIHEKFRQAGQPVMCLPDFKTWHRFLKPGGHKYVLNTWEKARNYVLGLKELGLSTAECREHFVEGMKTYNPAGAITPVVFDQLEKNPLTAKPPTEPGCSTCGTPITHPPLPAEATEGLPALLDYFAGIPRELDQHLHTLARVVARAVGFHAVPVAVAEITKRRETTAAIAAGLRKGDRLISWHTESHPGVAQVVAEAGIEHEIHEGHRLIGEDPLAFVFVDGIHTADAVVGQLFALAPRTVGYIALHDTVTYGTRGEDGGPGIMAAIAAFLQKHHGWIVVYHTANQHGLTVLSNRPEDRRKLPGVIRQALNFAASQAAAIASRLAVAPEEEVTRRLKICDLCPQRVETRCGACGCFLIDAPPPLQAKSVQATASCPLGYWEQEGEFVPPVAVPEWLSPDG